VCALVHTQPIKESKAVQAEVSDKSNLFFLKKEKKQKQKQNFFFFCVNHITARSPRIPKAA
jgi:hypothetical protein